jgi:Leukotriene A4 hydrolase, C-terminal.
MFQHLCKQDSLQFKKLKIEEWVFQPGLPDNCLRPVPARFVAVNEAVKLFESGALAKELNTTAWSTHEWLHFLRHLKTPLSPERIKNLDTTYQLSLSKNSEIADEWYRISIASDYEEAFPMMEQFLMRVGRKKFLEPLYAEMIKTEKGKKMANSIFEKAQKNYHPQTASRIEKIIK